MNIILRNSKVFRNYIMLTIAVIFVMLLTIKGLSIVRADSDVYEKSFVSIEIEEGDTLLSIAEEHAISSSYYSSYIDEVRSINNLNNDVIHTGCYLMIPVYERSVR